MKMLHRRLPILISGLIVLVLLLVLFWQYKARLGLVLPVDLTSFPIEGHQKLLVLAPHCDDETLGSGGIIQFARQAGMQVRVVIETNGDGFLFATMEEFHRLYPRHQDYIKMGEMRQQESIKALQTLGLSSENVIFLGYPDRGTPKLREDNWGPDQPYRSPYNGADRSPYALTYDPGAVYAGSDLLIDLINILEDYQPDLVLYPHPEDVHPDHWGLSVFTRLALAIVQHEKPGYQPDSYAYLVHRPDYPEPKGLKPAAYLLPPARLFVLNPTWFSYGLSQDEVDTKGIAVQQYRSQLPLLHTLLDSFVRRNELFAQPKGAVLSVAGRGSPDDPESWRDALGQGISPVQVDPIQDFITRDLVPSADLVALYAGQDQKNDFLLCAQTDDDPSPGIIYILRIKAITSEGNRDYVASNQSLQPDWRKATLSKKFICFQLPMGALGNPWVVFVGASSHEPGLGILDQVAWQSVAIEPGPGGTQR
jgi:LmbE family N-acetylglucosaminyl deacetylase